MPGDLVYRLVRQLFITEIYIEDNGVFVRFTPRHAGELSGGVFFTLDVVAGPTLSHALNLGEGSFYRAVEDAAMSELGYIDDSFRLKGAQKLKE